jgi:integrase
MAIPGTFRTRADAGRALARMQADMDRGDYFDPKAGRVTFTTYADRWVSTRTVKGQPLAPRTRELYESQLRLHIFPMLGAVELRHLDPSKVREWYASLPRRSATVKCYRLLRAICQTAVDDELMVKNPCAIRGAGHEAPTERPMISPEQVEAIAEAVEPRWKALVLLAAWGGLRLGELSALRKHNLDLETGLVRVTEAASDLAHGRDVRQPKSQAGRRTVAIPPHIAPELREHVERFSEPAQDGLVFVGPRGGPVRRNNFSADVWRPAVAKVLGLPDGLRLHDCRGFSATMAARHGATTKELMRRLGHASPAMALRYQRAEAERDVSLAKAMSEGRGEANVSADGVGTKREK